MIITSRLSADVVEGIAHIRRMGPSARVYLITRTPDAEQDRPYVARAAAMHGGGVLCLACVIRGCARP